MLQKNNVRFQDEIGFSKIAIWLLLIIGGTALALSIIFVLSVMAFVGLGLVFWGVTLLFITPQEYVKSTILDSITLSFEKTLEQVLAGGNYATAIYLPPKYLKNFESSRVYLTKEKTHQLPSPEQMQQKESQSTSSNQDYTLLTPPGAELARLFEDALGMSFTKATLDLIEDQLSRIIIEDLEIAENLETRIENNEVRVKMENSIYKNMNRSLKGLTHATTLLGCPIGSAIACALAKASGRPVVIQKHDVSEDGRTTTMEYLLLEEHRLERMLP